MRNSGRTMRSVNLNMAEYEPSQDEHPPIWELKPERSEKSLVSDRVVKAIIPEVTRSGKTG